MPNKEPSVWQKVAVPFAVVVLLVWTVVALSSIYTRDYTPLTVVTPVMLLVAGAVVGVSVNRPSRDEENDS